MQDGAATGPDKPLLRALARSNHARPPVWFMRQAGRYHSHYQRLRARYEFMQLCKQPQLAAEVTLGPIEAFGFDAAILFSDLLFPLEAMGMGLRYAPGPLLDWHLSQPQDLARLRGGAERVAALAFQAEALSLLRARLPAACALIGFVGGPLTLYAYAAAGSHEGFTSALPGLTDGVYEGFLDQLLPLLAANMALQVEGGAECVAIFDTAAGTLTPELFARAAAEPLARLLELFRVRCPRTPVIYYSRDTGPAHWRALEGMCLTCLGIDWRADLVQTLRTHADHCSVQGNIDPQWLLLAPEELEDRVRALFTRLLAEPASLRSGWICGLGHGVLQQTPEANVALVLRLQREMFG
ncbi:MAG TPA: uroporphyrinogen decarboxylase family protein [Steroidobacteraceae bacterium]|jgi:uroporphyrinogen decarboxylase|nr:uroporphyrinogen decarboxylase family protein [Steroidobacteraceae bacterium]